MLENNVFELRSRDSYPKILNDEIKLLSFNTENATLIGSVSYKIQKYPADIDLYEQVKTCCSKKDAIEYFKLGIQNIVNNIRIKQNHWVIEVKCGLDERFKIADNIDYYTAYDIINFIDDNINIISSKDHQEIKKLALLLEDTDNPMYYEKIALILRNYLVIRWSSDEIILGHKVKQGKKFYLEDCIDTIAPINIETIAVIEDKFTDLSNFYVVMFNDKLTGKDYVVNFPQNYLTDGKQYVIKGLRGGINKVLFSEVSKDVFKGIKRMYSLARLSNDMKLFKKIEPIISSDLAQLSQLKSELSTIVEILDFTSNIPWNVFYNHIQDIKWRIGGNRFLDVQDTKFLIDIIDNVIRNKNDIENNILDLLTCRDYLLNLVNNYAESFLKQQKLFIKF